MVVGGGARAIGAGRVQREDGGGRCGWCWAEHGGGGRRGDGGDGQRGLQEREGKSPFAEVAPSFSEFWGTMELGASGDRGEVEGEGVPLHQKQISYKRK